MHGYIHICIYGHGPWVLLVCAKEGMPLDELKLQLIREEDPVALRRRWSEVPGLMQERVH